MWGGLKWLPGKTPVKAEGVTVNAWSYDWVDPVVSLQDGYKLINTCDTYLYIVPAAGYYRDFLDHQWIYEKWSPWIMNRKQTLPEGTPSVLGGMFGVWNDKLTEMWSLLSQSPQAFKGGTIWQTIVTINGGMQAIGYGLLVLFC